MSDDRAIGQLQGEMNSVRGNVKTLFESMSKRKNETNEISLNFVSFQHMIEQNTITMNVAVSSMDELKQSVKDLAENINTKFNDTNSRLDILETKVFDSSKFMSGLNELAKNKWFWFYLTLTTLIIVGSFNPGILSELGALFKTIPKVK